MYESKISSARWIAYDLPGNVGWLTFLAELALCFIKRPKVMEDRTIFALLLLDVLCAAAMLTGIAELISERLHRLDRLLPKKRLYRGFGALTFGGLAGTVVSLLALAAALAKGLTGVQCLVILSAGGFLCALFGGLLLKEYKRV